MKRIFLLLLIILLSNCEGKSKTKIKVISDSALPINPVIKNKLDYIIDYKERLADSSARYSRPKSYWIFPYQKGDTCIIITMANFDFYNSAEMDGYFEYRNKYISVYDSKLLCFEGMIDTNFLKKGRISTLIDYHFDEIDSIPPPIPPHEPYYIEYVVFAADSLILNYEGY